MNLRQVSALIVFVNPAVSFGKTASSSSQPIKLIAKIKTETCLIFLNYSTNSMIAIGVESPLLGPIL